MWGVSKNWNGVVGESTADVAASIQAAGGDQTIIGTIYSRTAGVAGFNGGPGTGAAICGVSQGPGPAGYFAGDVIVTGDVQLPGADCAEQFNVIDADSSDPGTVMVISDAGTLRPSFRDYDHRVAGVISGAGNLRPGLVLGHEAVASGRLPIALIGKVFCKVDADLAPIEVGDLLTTSPTPGHAMRADDRERAFGAVLGKALGVLASGRGLVPVLIALQ
jgi:hypothetical protein